MISEVLSSEVHSNHRATTLILNKIIVHVHDERIQTYGENAVTTVLLASTEHRQWSYRQLVLSGPMLPTVAGDGRSVAVRWSFVSSRRPTVICGRLSQSLGHLLWTLTGQLLRLSAHQACHHTFVQCECIGNFVDELRYLPNTALSVENLLSTSNNVMRAYL